MITSGCLVSGNMVHLQLQFSTYEQSGNEYVLAIQTVKLSTNVSHTYTL